MLGYFLTLKDAFNWHKKLSLKQLVIFAFMSVFAYIFLVGLYFFGFMAAMHTPLMDYLTVDAVYEITASVLLALRVILSIPLILHVLKSIVGGIAACIH